MCLSNKYKALTKIQMKIIICTITNTKLSMKKKLQVRDQKRGHQIQMKMNKNDKNLHLNF